MIKINVSTATINICKELLIDELERNKILRRHKQEIIKKALEELEYEVNN